MKQLSLILLGLALNLTVWCQPQNRNWYFGYNAGIHWDAAGNPTAVTDGILTSRNNATSISDTDGDLVFYSDGHRVYNKFHQQILHGDSLYTSRIINASGYHGSLASGGSALLPSVDNPDIYVMFTCNLLASVSSGFQAGLVYNRMSISGDSVILPKNQMVYTASNMTEYLADRILAIRHANGRDWWLITHRVNLDSYWVWLYDPEGVHGPYAQQIGQPIGAAGYSGWLVCNKEGNKIVSVANGGYAEVLDFDRCTGQLSNWVDLGFPPYPNFNPHVGSGTFSANSQVAYIASEEAVFQYDLTAPVPKATETIIYSNPYSASSLPLDSQLKLGFLKLGLDDKLYVSLCPNGSIDNQPSTYQFNPRTRYLAVIHDPDVLGIGCNFQLNGFYLGGKYSTYAMPNTAYHLGPLIGSGCDTLVPPLALFDAQETEVCPSSCVTFSNQTQSVGNTVSYQWLFFGGTPSSSNDTAPTVCYSSSGIYDVTLIATNPFGSDTVVMTNYITVHSSPVVSINPVQDSLQASQGNASYQWSLNGNALVETSSIIPVQGSGTYSVTVTDNNDCTSQTSYVVTSMNALVEASFTVHPNPASSEIVCSWSNIQVEMVELFDVLGRKTLTRNVDNSHQAVLDISMLGSGVYTLRAVVKNGNALVRKLVVE